MRIQIIAIIITVALSFSAKGQILNNSFHFWAGGESAGALFDGSFFISNAAAPDNISFCAPNANGVADRASRVYGIGQLGGVVHYVWSTPFFIESGEVSTLEVGDLTISTSPRPSVQQLAMSASQPVLSMQGDTLQLTVTATLSDGSIIDVTNSPETDYFCSNWDLMSICQNGLATRARTRSDPADPLGVNTAAPPMGSAFLRANYRGKVAIVNITVAPGDPLTRVTGFLLDENEQPIANDWVSISNELGFLGWAMTDADGAYFLDFVPSTEKLTVATLIGTPPVAAVQRDIETTPGGLTDTGILMVGPPPSGPAARVIAYAAQTSPAPPPIEIYEAAPDGSLILAGTVPIAGKIRWEDHVTTAEDFLYFVDEVLVGGFFQYDLVRADISGPGPFTRQSTILPARPAELLGASTASGNVLHAIYPLNSLHTYYPDAMGDPGMAQVMMMPHGVADMSQGSGNRLMITGNSSAPGSVDMSFSILDVFPTPTIANTTCLYNTFFITDGTFMSTFDDKLYFNLSGTLTVADILGDGSLVNPAPITSYSSQSTYTLSGDQELILVLTNTTLTPIYPSTASAAVLPAIFGNPVVDVATSGSYLWVLEQNSQNNFESRIVSFTLSPAGVIDLVGATPWGPRQRQLMVK